MIITLLLLASLPLRNKKGWICGNAKAASHTSAKLPLQNEQESCAVLQSNYCDSAILVLQNCRTGSLFSKSLIKRSSQGVSLKKSVSPPVCEEVPQ